MLTVLIGVVVGVLVGLLARRDASDFPGRIVAVIMCTAVCGVLSFLLANVLSHVVPKAYEPTFQEDLFAMQSTTDLQGHFFLLGGSIDSVWTYRFYVKVGDLLKPQSVQESWRSDVFVQMLDTKPPHLEVSKQVLTGWGSWFAIIDDNHYAYTFVVPTGSVVQDFKL